LRALSTFGRFTVTYAMAPFFSYETFSSVAAAADELIGQDSLYESAQSADGFADDQGLHLVGAFVGVERLRIREVAAHPVINGDAVAAANLARPPYRLSTPCRTEALGD